MGQEAEVCGFRYRRSKPRRKDNDQLYADRSALATKTGRTFPIRPKLDLLFRARIPFADLPSRAESAPCRRVALSSPVPPFVSLFRVGFHIEVLVRMVALNVRLELAAFVVGEQCFFQPPVSGDIEVAAVQLPARVFERVYR